MADKKSYNMMALRGIDMDDAEIANDFIRSGIHVPNELLYTPEFPLFLINASHAKNLQELPKQINDATNQPYTTEEAMQEADANRASAMRTLDRLMNK